MAAFFGSASCHGRIEEEEAAEAQEGVEDSCSLVCSQSPFTRTAVHLQPFLHETLQSLQCFLASLSRWSHSLTGLSQAGQLKASQTCRQEVQKI